MNCLKSRINCEYAVYIIVQYTLRNKNMYVEKTGSDFTSP